MSITYTTTDTDGTAYVEGVPTITLPALVKVDADCTEGARLVFPAGDGVADGMTAQDIINAAAEHFASQPKWDGFEYVVTGVVVTDGKGKLFGLGTTHETFSASVVYRRIDRRGARPEEAAEELARIIRQNGFGAGIMTETQRANYYHRIDAPAAVLTDAGTQETRIMFRSIIASIEDMYGVTFEDTTYYAFAVHPAE